MSSAGHAHCIRGSRVYVPIALLCLMSAGQSCVRIGFKVAASDSSSDAQRRDANALDSARRDGAVDTAFSTSDLLTSDLSTLNVYRKSLVISAGKSSETLTDFPVLLQLAADPDLAVHQPAAEDIYIRAEDGRTLLAQEIASYNAATGSLSMWIRIPQLSSTIDNKLYLYFLPGLSKIEPPAPKNAWSNHFGEVWHLDKAGTGTTTDFHESVRSQPFAQAGGGIAASIPKQVTGKILGALSFDGVDDYVLLPSTSGWGANLAEGTLSHWVTKDDGSATSRVVYYETAKQTTGDHDGFGSIYDELELHSAVHLDLSRIYFLAQERPFYSYWMEGDAPGIASTGTWVNVAVTWELKSAKQAIMYVNGVEKTRQAVNLTDVGRYVASYRSLGAPLDLTGGSGNNRAWPGKIDELRLANVQRSAGWIAFEYANQNNPPGSWQVGPLESVKYEPGYIP